MHTLPARDQFFAALRQAGMPEVPARFSVAPLHQVIPRVILDEIDEFVRVFDRVTARPAWRETVTASAPEIARRQRREVCFFSAWDFHIPDERSPPQLIEFNDNGSGFLFAALVNRLFYEAPGVARPETVGEPPPFATFAERLAGIVGREAEEFFGHMPGGLLLVLDDAESLRDGRFQSELILLRDLLRRHGWQAEIGSADEIACSGGHLLWCGRPVDFVVNRSTDFFWEADVFSALRAAYHAGNVYVAPNPFTYATRSDKRLLEFLSHPDWDEKLGILPSERDVLAAHVPETWLVGEDNVEVLALRKAELFFKPVHGFASRGLLPHSQIGRSRLRRLLKRGERYVAQKRVPKRRLHAPEEGACLWADLRVWAYRGRRLMLSGRASRDQEVLDLAAPGGWLATYAGR